MCRRDLMFRYNKLSDYGKLRMAIKRLVYERSLSIKKIH